MKTLFITVTILLCLNKTFAIPKSLHKFIPSNYEVRDSATADFNNDHLDDWAIVIQPRQPIYIKEDSMCWGDTVFYPKQLLIFFKNSDGTYDLTKQNSKIFGNCNWGVQGGDPFVKISNRKNTLIFDFLTGGSLRYYLQYIFRLQDNDWYLIGATGSLYQVPYEEQYVTDMNLITGDVEEYTLIGKKRSDYKKKTQPKQALIKLDDIEVNSEADPLYDIDKG